MTKKYVITGGPCSGKTTLVKYLEKLGYPVIHEVARDLMEANNIRYLELSEEEKLKFQISVMEKQIERESLLREEHAFLDRGVLDALAYCVAGGLEIPSRLAEVSRKNRYDMVFLLDLVPYKKDSIRLEDPETARKIHRIIEETYREMGYYIINISASDVEKRAKEILYCTGLLIRN